ncbi:Gfo/Idh/MocA family oxidoreductase [Maribius pontilimi]|uniref:Gfo/Idh/MocA family oxidoreductase n=1 Tax=Palleronia pontilimi TaxID=1964209 RepID=A0A934IEP1_9RHOB|nr:Gfo/Idh/MocA family oxidoreductase [Palleronia pontilimi]MBJ3762070.1 Gfo/Idh/MocA family oxidoreductase [Palleronia pontilimi]
MGDILNFGILGASSFALDQMAPAIHMARGARLAGLATRSPGKAAPFRDIAPDLAVFDSYDALLASDAIDAVYIPLPNHLHLDWSLKAMAAGRHVLCEKPMAPSAEDYAPLIAARDASGRLAAEAYMIVHHPQWRMVRDLLADGTIGDLRHVNALFCYNNEDEPENIRNQRGMGGGGLRDIGVYTFGCTRFATGQEPLRLSARLQTERDYDTYARIDAEFPGFGYQAMVSMRMARHQSVSFHGSAGTILLNAPFNGGAYDQAEITIEPSGTERRVIRFPEVNQYVLQVEAFCRSASTGEPYDWPLEQARGTQAMIDAALKGDQTATS